ncbi:hypothetical protein FRX31_035478 [Thalictrum thalictroides]|uniref:Uncharacterized protein n=1 Tax=Thalictrum thalictroides TaxID=46969 RepID=A0A7J6URR2_THATH|nr:hypothetical protein FRX31_035478 [Thalictrum thalictroides]
MEANGNCCENVACSNKPISLVHAHILLEMYGGSRMYIIEHVTHRLKETKSSTGHVIAKSADQVNW